MTYRTVITASLCLVAAFVWASPASDARQKARSVMEAYKRAHPACEWCGHKPGLLSRNEAHHVIPVSVDQDKAADSNNLVTLCRPCHVVLGHNNDARMRRYVANLKAIIAIREVKP